MKATNEWAVPVLRYFFGSVRWFKTDLVRLDRSTRRIMRDQRAHYYSSAIERVNLPRTKGGRGISGAELTWEKEVVSVAIYLTRSTDEHIVGALRCLEFGEDHSIIVDARAVLTKYHITGVLPPRGRHLTSPQLPWWKIKRQVERAQQEKLVQRLEGKSMHGVHEKQTKMPGVNMIASHRWLVQGRLRAESEAMVIAAQCGVLETNAYRVEVQGKEGCVECRLCGYERETIGHVLSSCPEHIWGLIKDTR